MGAASPQLAAARPTYDLKKGTKARTATWGDPHENVDWIAVELSNGAQLCAGAAASAINNAHSNVK